MREFYPFPGQRPPGVLAGGIRGKACELSQCSPVAQGMRALELALGPANNTPNHTP